MAAAIRRADRVQAGTASVERSGFLFRRTFRYVFLLLAAGGLFTWLFGGDVRLGITGYDRFLDKAISTLVSSLSPDEEESTVLQGGPYSVTLAKTQSGRSNLILGAVGCREAQSNGRLAPIVFGTVRNRAGRSLTLSDLRVVYFDERGRELKRVWVPIGIRRLDSGRSTDFEARLYNPPSSAHAIEVSLGG